MGWDVIDDDAFLTRVRDLGVEKLHLEEDHQQQLTCCRSTSRLFPTTRILIDRGVFAKMKAGSILINLPRGKDYIVDEAALHDALASGRPRGAALDVSEHEGVEHLPRPT